MSSGRKWRSRRRPAPLMWPAVTARGRAHPPNSVGHEPQLGTIAGELLRWVRPRPYPIRSAAVSCIRLGAAPLRRPRVLWVIEPTDNATAEQLHKKIASKMDVAKVFGGGNLAVGIVRTCSRIPRRLPPFRIRLPHISPRQHWRPRWFSMYPPYTHTQSADASPLLGHRGRQAPRTSHTGRGETT